MTARKILPLPLKSVKLLLLITVMRVRREKIANKTNFIQSKQKYLSKAVQKDSILLGAIFLLRTGITGVKRTSVPVAADSSFFSMLGIFQSNKYISNVVRLIQNDPYAFHIREKLANAHDFDLERLETEYPQTRMQEIMKYGFPGLDDIRLYSDFVLSYDRRNRVAHWVYEHLRAPCVTSTSVRRHNCEFQPDMNIPSLFRVDIEDYQNSGFDRGHLAAAGNHKCHQTHCNETFYLTNITPQVGKGFNRDAWNNLEIYVRELTERYGSVYVCTGPLYMPRRAPNGKLYVEHEVIGPHSVAVPTHFYKVVTVESKLPNGSPYMEAYVMPNASISDSLDLRSFLVDIRDIERLAGLQFFKGLRRSFFFGTNYRTRPQIFENFS